MNIWEILGNEYRSSRNIYNSSSKILLEKNESFVLSGIDENGMATIIKTRPSHRVLGDDEIWVEYDSLVGSRPTGRCVMSESGNIGTGCQWKEPLPAFA